jgi:glycosyltransferase involved in cell wall biosynthesis
VRISGLVVCKNEADRIDACLRSLSFCDEIVVVDSGSTDDTVAIAQRHGARVIERPWKNANDQKEFGRQQAQGTWLVNLDADEVVSDALRDEILALVERGGDDGVDAYLAPFKNYFRTAWVRRCGYYPDPHVRFIRRAGARWDLETPVHDNVLADGATRMLKGHVEHHSFHSMEHYVDKSKAYAEGFARHAHAQGRRASAPTILLHTGWRFFRIYVLKGGFLEGALGLTIAGLQAFDVFRKYTRLWELGRFPPEEDVGEGAPPSA